MGEGWVEKFPWREVHSGQETSQGEGKANTTPNVGLTCTIVSGKGPLGLGVMAFFPRLKGRNNRKSNYQGFYF